MNNQYIDNKYAVLSIMNKVQSDKQPGLREKLLSFSCYLTFGLSGLIILILNVVSDEVINEFSFIHTFQSVMIGIFTSILVLLIGTFTSVSSLLIGNGELSQMINTLIHSNLQLTVFIFSLSFGLLALLGQKSYLPGIKKLAKNFFN